MSAALAAGLAAAAAALTGAFLASVVGRGLARRAMRAGAAVAASAEVVLRAGREGREPGALERRRLLALGGCLGFAAGTIMGGPGAGALLAFGAPAGVSRLLLTRRRAYRRALERDAPAIARALADALSGGHSLRGAVAEAAALPGPGGVELGRVAGELALGVPTEVALDALRRRVAAPALDTLVAAALLQRRAGGDLAGQLRELALAFEDQAQLEDELRAATAQARFTGLIVVVLPLGGALLAELASPGFLIGIASSPLSASLVGLALALALVAAVAIRQLGRVRM